jgi:hypothetical protein
VITVIKNLSTLIVRFADEPAKTCRNTAMRRMFIVNKLCRYFLFKFCFEAYMPKMVKEFFTRFVTKYCVSHLRHETSEA